MQQALQQAVIHALDEGKGEDITTLDISKLTSIADSMIICSARSTRHLKALANAVSEQAKEQGSHPLHVEGDPHSGWILIDLNDIIVHVMLPETREFYNIEKLWASDND